jgi:hypothetical protein
MHSSGTAISTFVPSGESVRVEQPVTIHPDGTVQVASDTYVTGKDGVLRHLGKSVVFTCKIGKSAFFYV